MHCLFREIIFIRTAFFYFYMHFYIYLYGVPVAYRNNEFYWNFALNFFTSYSTQQCVELFFCFLQSEVDGVLLSLLIAVLW